MKLPVVSGYDVIKALTKIGLKSKGEKEAMLYCKKNL
jgi:hypothetical protein